MKRLILLLAFCGSAHGQFTSAHSIWSRPITPAAPADGQALVWSASQGKFIFSASGGSSSTFYTISFDGMGASLSGAATRCIAIKATGSLQSVRLQACNGYAASPIVCNAAGSGTFDILTASNASYASTGPSAASSIHGSGSLLSISSAYAVDGTLTGWTTTGFGGQTACVAMSAPTAISLDVILEVR